MTGSTPELKSPGSNGSLGVFMINTYQGTGIGDFGQSLADRLRRILPSLAVDETRPAGNGNPGKILRILTWRGPLLANVGLTSWGQSRLWNFIGFSVLALRSKLHRPTVLILHNAIEVINLSQSGYSVSETAKRFAHWVVRGLNGCRIIVFSLELAATLRALYKINPYLVMPIPCDGDPPHPDSRSNVVVTPGYFSRYKSLETIPEVRRLCKTQTQFVVVGGSHRVLSRNRAYIQYLADLKSSLKDANVSVLEGLDSADFSNLLSHASLGFLPYASTQGGSATFSALASAGIPVVATDLPEFKWLETLGAGIVLCPHRPEAFAREIDRLSSDAFARADLSSRQREFAKQYSWERFLQHLLLGMGMQTPPALSPTS